MEYYTFSSLEFYKILKEVAEVAVKNALVDTGMENAIIWRTVAIKRYGAKLINKLEKYKLIEKKQHYTNGNYFYDVKELNYALTTEQRHKFFLQK